MTLGSLDTELLLLVNRQGANAFFDAVMPFLSAWGYLLALPFFLYLIMQTQTGSADRRRPSPGFVLALFLISCCAVFFADALEYVLKNAIGRVRPCRALEGVRLITYCPRSFSMPSGHALSSFAFATPLCYLTGKHANRMMRSYPLLLAAGISFSRVYLGVHYPSDIVAGGLLGGLIGILLAFVFEWGVRRKTGRGNRA